MFLKKCFIRMTDLSTIETRRQSNFKKKRRHLFDLDNSRKIIESFKNRHWNEKLNSANRKQKKKIKDDRNKITTTETKFKKRRSSKARESENYKTKFRKMKLLERSFRNDDFKRLIINGKATCDWVHVILLFFSQSNMLNLSCQKKRRYEIKVMKDEWRFARHMNALKWQSSLNRWHIFKFKRIRSKWNASIDKRRRIQADENKDWCVFFLILLQVVIIIIVVIWTNELSNLKHFFLHRLKIYWLFLQLLLFLTVKLLSWNQCLTFIKSIYHRKTRFLFIFWACYFRSSCLQQFNTWCLCSLRNSQRLCISMNITSQNFLNVSRNNVMNMKSSKRNDESSFFVTVLNSLQSSWKFFFHILIEVKRFLKRRCEKNTKVKISSRWSTLVSF